MNDKRFDPARIAKLDNPERRKNLPPEQLLDLLGLTGSEDILDVGAGGGYFTFPAVERTSGIVYALDAQSAMLEYLKSRMEEQKIGRIKIIEGEAEHIPMEDEKVDAVICSMVLHEVDPPDQGLREIQRVLKKGGRALCIEWEHVETESGPPQNHRISSSEMSRVLEGMGFKVLSRQPWTEAFYSIVFEK
ncbi:class I SAM-dependent methyltransferase [Paenibacillus dokdonensis]|uniref:Class I SAM-dependent methyltransferase n=1 Tax=Paenibacillus dokdonensis TaxID=2567944 RepID=A0ABU6GVH5_9BACL|nr:class I SAM-dependent methyltransferase [Paenibacillus dokdonensis]MEC0243708.1 class I SAM-dependent methyltransferase [Paenibacillus dokdonensis]